ncbi:MAG: cellulase family glycosylhydrolase [Myxococcales bacterium]|nr:cellulase family glycosylhydrolase [Myxococcales bacterium]
MRNHRIASRLVLRIGAVWLLGLALATLGCSSSASTSDAASASDTQSSDLQGGDSLRADTSQADVADTSLADIAGGADASLADVPGTEDTSLADVAGTEDTLLDDASSAADTNADATGTTDAATDDGSATADAVDVDASATIWLHTDKNQIKTADGAIWRGRGANIQDTRSCNACAWNQPNVGEVKRRIDELVDVWGANFMRLTLESYSDSGGRVHWAGVLDDSDYLDDIKEIVAHIGSKPGVHVLLSLWIDPSFTSDGWPTDETSKVWERLAESFAFDGHVLFGLVNEPESNFDGGLDADVWEAMNKTVAAIRAVETKLGAPQHLIAVQGTRAWARNLDYYVSHPITAGGGTNIVYETHPYNPQADFDALVFEPSKTLPVVIGEFGPAGGQTLPDATVLMDGAELRNIPYLAWTFHMRCPPSLLVDNSGGGCGVGMTLEPTEWGMLIKNRLAQPWKTP